jgi:hypothetical protein
MTRPQLSEARLGQARVRTPTRQGKLHHISLRDCRSESESGGPACRRFAGGWTANVKSRGTKYQLILIILGDLILYSQNTTIIHSFFTIQKMHS